MSITSDAVVIFIILVKQYFSQSNGGRFYLGGRILFSAQNVKLFKKWDTEYPMMEEENDGNFLSYLLVWKH